MPACCIGDIDCLFSCFFILINRTFIFNSCYGVQDGNQAETDTVPTPVVIIDQDSDPDATVVEITFGDRLGTLIDTVSHCLRIVAFYFPS